MGFGSMGFGSMGFGSMGFGSMGLGVKVIKIRMGNMSHYKDSNSWTFSEFNS